MSDSLKRNKSFLVEASIISVSNLFVKIIGMIFKIPLDDVLGSGMGIFNAALSFYAILYTISSAGLPSAISRMVAVSNEKGKAREALAK